MKILNADYAGFSVKWFDGQVQFVKWKWVIAGIKRKSIASHTHKELLNMAVAWLRENKEGSIIESISLSYPEVNQ